MSPSTPFQPAPERRRQPRQRSTCLPLVLILFALACLVILAAMGLLVSLPSRAAQTFGPPAAGLNLADQSYLSAIVLIQAKDLVRPFDPQGEERPFTIELGESTYRISERLQSEGFISNAEAFRSYLKYAGLDTTLQAGDYTLNPAMTPIEIARALQDATPAEVNFQVLPGWRMEEIAAALPTSGLNIDSTLFLSAAESQLEGYSISSDLPEDADLEGFFFPDSYLLSRDLTADELVKTFLDQFEEKVNQDIRDGFQRQGLGLFEGVTLASIIEREAVIDDEMPLIASVFHNRLALGIKLDSDPTVQYAIGWNQSQKTWWTNPLSAADLQVQSPYNTYIVPGLPPGPIANPGILALQAAAYPAQSPYYYFRAACDGSGKHLFAETFEDHLKNGCP